MTGDGELVENTRRRGFLGVVGAVATSIAGCLGTGSSSTETPTTTANYTNEGTELSNLRILSGPTRYGAKIAFDIEETGGVEKVATPTIRFYDVEAESVLPQVPHIELDADEQKEYKMGFVYSVDTGVEIEPEPGNTLLVSVADELVKVAEVVESD